MALSCTYIPFQSITCSAQKPSTSPNLDHFKTSLSSAVKPWLKNFQHVPSQMDATFQAIKTASVEMVDAFVDSTFQFVDQPLLPSQRNFAPIDELGEAVLITRIEGDVPHGFPVGVYIRNGPNPLFGGLKSVESFFGKSSHIWVEGEGMLHALYFTKTSDAKWTVSYNNRHVETETFELEKRRNRPSFLPAIEGDSPAVLAAYLFNVLRFGKVNKYISNTSVFEHSGKLYSIAENHMPQEIDILTLRTLRNWDANGAWKRPCTAHPKIAPDSRELVIMGVDAVKPYLEVGIISADGKKLVHRADLKLDRCALSHEIGVTQRFNVILDFPLTINIERLVRGGPLIKYNKDEYARIGVMPRYGEADSVQWFNVAPCCMFHVFNCFEDGDEVVVWGCRALESIVPGPDWGTNKFEWFSRGFRSTKSVEQHNVVAKSAEEGPLRGRAYEWRLNMRTGEAREKNLTGTEFSMDFPMINGHFVGLKNKYGYAQVADSIKSSEAGLPKFGSLAKLYFEEHVTRSSSSNYKENQTEDLIKIEYHNFGDNTFCSGTAFVPREGSFEEEDGWIITFVHSEDTGISQVHVIDTKKFSSEAVAKITLPCRVPYGFHGAFVPIDTFQ